MKRALLLLALSSATLVEYDQELVEFICRFYLDSPPFSIARDDKSSAERERHAWNAARARRNGRRARNMCAEASTQIAALRRRA